MPKVRLSHYVLGIEGLALLRNWFRGDESAAPFVKELERTFGSLDRSPVNVSLDIPEMDVLDGYAQWAPVYDDSANPLIMAEEPVVRGLIDRLPIGYALDAASGTGRHAHYLRSKGHQVAAVDLSDHMLAKARLKVPGAVFCRGSLVDLPLETATFDLAVCSLALDYMPDLSRPVGELARVLRPGGWAIISDFHPTSRLLGGGSFFQDKDGNFGLVRGFQHDHAAYVSAFVSAGFEIRDCAEPRWGDSEIATMGIAAVAPEAFRAALTGAPIALVWLLSRR